MLGIRVRLTKSVTASQDTAPVVTTSAVPPPPSIPVVEVQPQPIPEGESISVEELRDLSQAVTSLKADRALEEELEELKEEREEYREVQWSPPWSADSSGIMSLQS